MPGRFERVDAGQDFAVIVDYAHTEDALARLSGSRPATPTGTDHHGLWMRRRSGSRGNDRTWDESRPGSSDVVFLTSDNPRTEDSEAILRDIEQGVRGLPASERGTRRT